MRETALRYEAPAVRDYGSIADHTFPNPGNSNSHKGFDDPSNKDGFHEISSPCQGPGCS